MTLPLDKLAICNDALAYSGELKIDDADLTTADLTSATGQRGRLCNQFYDVSLQALIEEFGWEVKAARLQYAPGFEEYNEEFGTSEVAITDITQAYPAVVTTLTAHNLPDKSHVYMSEIESMTDVNSKKYYIKVIDSMSFQLVGVNSTNFSEYTLVVIPKLFVAVARGGGGNQVMTSQNGDGWSLRTTPTDNQWRSVAYGNGILVAVSTDGVGDRVMTSPDGINWTIRVSAADNNWREVCYGNGLFVAVASSGTGDRVMTSPDGINWTIRVSATDNDWFSVCYGNGLFVAVAWTNANNQVMTSADNGVTWILRTTPTVEKKWESVCYGNGLFVAVASTGLESEQVMTSPDGITWTARTVTNFWESVCYGNGVFVAVTKSDSTPDRVMTSLDGVTWTPRTAAANNDWVSVTYGNGIFVAVAESGIGNRVMTSSDNGVTWEIQESADDQLWPSVIYKDIATFKESDGILRRIQPHSSGRILANSDGLFTYPLPADFLYPLYLDSELDFDIFESNLITRDDDATLFYAAKDEIAGEVQLSSAFGASFLEALKIKLAINMAPRLGTGFQAAMKTKESMYQEFQLHLDKAKMFIARHSNRTVDYGGDFTNRHLTYYRDKRRYWE